MSDEMSDGEARLLLEEHKRRRRLIVAAVRGRPLSHLWCVVALCLLGLGIWAWEKWLGADGGDGLLIFLVLLIAGALFMDMLDRSVNRLHRRMDALVELLQSVGWAHCAHAVSWCIERPAWVKDPSYAISREVMMSHEMSDGEARVLLKEQKRRTRLVAEARGGPLNHFWFVGGEGDGASAVITLLIAATIFMDMLDRSVNRLHRRMDALVELLQEDGMLKENVPRSERRR